MEVNKEAAALSCQNGNAAMRNGDCDRAVESPSMVTISVSSKFRLRYILALRSVMVHTLLEVA